MRRQQRLEREGLRRLHRAQCGAVERFADMAVVIDTLDRIGDGNGRDRRAGLPGGMNRARD